MASTATTYLHDLHHEARPERTGAVLPGIAATAANLAGQASGPLVAGASADWLPKPLITTQVIFTLAMAVCLALVLSTPETVDLELPAAKPLNRFVLRPGCRRTFGAAGALGAFAFAILGLISSLGASVLHGTLHTDSHLVVGLAAFLMFGSAAAAQLVLGRLPLPPGPDRGDSGLPSRPGPVAVALYYPALWLYLVAVSLSGAGSGLLFKGVVERAVSVRPAAFRRADRDDRLRGGPLLWRRRVRRFRVARPRTRSVHIVSSVRSPFLTSSRRKCGTGCQEGPDLGTRSGHA
ncbi:hypothetical protein [Streptomyces sp. NPDC001083]|uniref:hypothetical protein n=1 Tax=Streptomyces sp. NPDC001083 TaxID=3364545 RepID=UPI0036973FCB